MQLIRLIAAAAVCLIATGCATVNPMAFDKKSTSIDTKEKSVVLMTIDVSRSDGSRFVPEPFVAKFEKPGAQNKDDRQNFRFSTDDSVQENGHSVYLIRVALAPGDYKLGDVTGMARAFPINGVFVVPLGLDIKVKPNSVSYVGRVTAKLRDRVGGEFRAGPLLPLIDQSIAGMSGSTWDVSTDNMAEKDLAGFRATFPVLNNITIDTAPLPAFDRAAAQRLWDGDTKEAPKSASASTASTSLAK